MKPAALMMLWANCVERLKDRINNRSFWEALESCHPIAVESDFLILGMATERYNLVSHLQQVSHMHSIAQVVQELFNQPLQIRIIEGTTLQDWALTKEHDARIAAMKMATATREIRRETRVDGWDGLYDYIARLYMQTPMRALPQGKARYVNDALYALAEAMDTLYSDFADEATERSLARIIERIANASDMPATTLAFELDRLRAWRKGSADTTEEEAAS